MRGEALASSLPGFWGASQHFPGKNLAFRGKSQAPGSRTGTRCLISTARMNYPEPEAGSASLLFVSTPGSSRHYGKPEPEGGEGKWERMRKRREKEKKKNPQPHNPWQPSDQNNNQRNEFRGVFPHDCR